MIRVYDFGFNLLFLETRVNSTSWTVYYNGIGTFEAHIPLDSELAGILEQHKYLIVCEDDKTAVLTGHEVGDELILYGRTPNWLLGKRIAPKTESVTGAAGTICANLVQNAFSDVSDFEVLTPPASDSITVERSAYKTVFAAVSEYLSLCGMGHRLDFDRAENKWVFSIYNGVEIPLLISEANKNAYDASVSYDILDLADCGYYGENGYLQGDKSGIYRWETVLQDETESEAAISLAAKKENAEISLKLRNLKLGRDYNLGDVVRIQIIKGNWRTTVKNRITGVRFSKKGGFSEEIPIFGETGGAE